MQIDTNTPFLNFEDPQGASTTRPAHERTYLALRDMVLFGDLAPGQPVTIQGLTAAVNSGVTPIREAIRRLTAEGALVFHGNRRVSVPVLTRDDLNDLHFLRKTTEYELALRACHAATPACIDDLEAIDLALDAAIASGDIRAYLRGNYAFHARLYRLAGSPVLTEVTDKIWLRLSPSMRVVCGRLGTQNLPDWHKEILEALRAGNAVAVAEATLRDLDQGMSQMIAALDPDDRPPDSIDT